MVCLSLLVNGLRRSSRQRAVAAKRPETLPGDVLTPSRCGNGHELTPDNLVPAAHLHSLALPPMRG
jgi:hypothetical protein